jgi:predicted DNA-binding transcriptional regulator AlpA
MEESHQSPHRVRTRSQTAQILGISNKTLDRLEKVGRIGPRIALSTRRVGFSDAAIEAFIKSNSGVA